MINLIFIFMFFPVWGFGQLIAPDFTLTDINGNTFNLYQQTDAGKTVVLDFFSTTCGTCITNTPVLDSIWQAYGFQGDSIWVWGIESTGMSDSMIHIFEDTYYSTFPLFGTSNDDIVIPLYNITYTPQYFVVCPDRTMKPYAIGSIGNGISLCQSTGADENMINSGINIYSYKKQIFICNSGKSFSNSVLEIFDINLNRNTFNLTMGAEEQISLSLFVSGIAFYRLSDMNGSLICKGKLFSE